jgi:formate dehydrogenase
VVKISADKHNPHSWTDFCAKGRTAAALVDHPRRITRPMQRVGDSYVEATWNEARADQYTPKWAIKDARGAPPRAP